MGRENARRPKDAIINLRIRAQLKELIRERAESEGRTVSGWILFLIKKELGLL